MLKSAYIQVSKSCNLRCKHCFNESIAESKLCLDSSRVGEIADQLREVGCRVTVVTGGEPTLHPELTCALASALFQNGVVPILYSHMSPIPDPLLGALKDSGIFVIHTSIDSPDAEEHDWFRGRAGAFVQTMSTVEKALGIGLEVWVRMTLTRFNYLKVAQMADLAAARGFRSFRVRPMVPVGRAQRSMCLDSSQLHYAVERLLAWRRSYDGPMEVQFLPTCFEFLLEPTDEQRAVPCFVAKAFISPTGDVQGCNYFTPIIGNLFETPLSELWPSYSREMTDGLVPTPVCASCSTWKVCRGGCKANNSALGVPLGDPDPLCFKPRLNS